MLRKILVILSGNAAASLLLLARNLIVARLITVEDYGIAATFAMTMALVEMSTQFGLQQQIVQDRNGEDPHFQAVLQGFQLLRGIIAGGVLLALAAPIADFLNIPEVTWAYQVMALMPVLRSLQHFDIHRLNRAMRFGPMVLTGVIPALVSLMAVLPLALWLGDYRVMLFALLLQEALGAIISQIVAERPYRLAFDRAIMGQSLRFGWPLLMNGMLLFLVMQGDKVIVVRELGMAALGIFGMGMTLTLTPTLILTKSVQSLFLPKLSTAAHPEARHRLNVAIMQTVMMLCLVFVTGTVIVNEPLVHVLLGAKFAPLTEILVWLAIMQAFRILKVGPTVMAIASGQTARLAWTNIPRVVLLVPAAWVAATGGGLTPIVLIAILGEALGFGVTMALVGRDIPREGLVLPAAVTTAMLVLFTLTAAGWLPGPDWAGPLSCGLALVGAVPVFHSLVRFIRPWSAT
ncbi:oligosaccharide flippase family protein [Cereibacter sphaeroides]|uniref:oligosaccharide flippase family protein n=1 Tax=Cereibacter sphaeroides TaxID=1063 RepID=UPI001F2618EB|nr:oligosaccharide flippase family protein [Cereibacter sphaeroides]MCE6950232.1 oligosaccharide flippase family protein [Cereibacter sphaeroides]